MPSTVPHPTPIFRIVHIENLPTLIQRAHIHAPSCVPPDGLPWRGVHAAETQASRAQTQILCGPRGTVSDYVGFYLGYRSPMLYRIKTGWNVQQVDQAEIVYLVAFAQAIEAQRLRFVFTDRHSLARVAAFYDDLSQLHQIDFETCYATRWNTTPTHPDRQEKKQAEFLVHGGLPWSLIHTVGVSCSATRDRVRETLAGLEHELEVAIKKPWYY
ncbi:MAG: DUF4433 domain-containing protein [Planctomycetota bacterium]